MEEKAYVGKRDSGEIVQRLDLSQDSGRSIGFIVQE